MKPMNKNKKAGKGTMTVSRVQVEGEPANVKRLEQIMIDLDIMSLSFI